MTPRERILAALRHEDTDRVPRCEIWVDALLEELGQPDEASAQVHGGQDAFMMPSHLPPGSHSWGNGIDEWGQVWKNGQYVDGAIRTLADLRRYSPALDTIDLHFDAARVAATRERYPDHCMLYGRHLGPFTAGYMAMGFTGFFSAIARQPALVHALLEARTEWCLAMFRRAVSLGAEVLVLGDDAGHNEGPMVSPRMWREFVLPHHRRIVEEMDVPVIWHSDGNVQALLPMGIEAGFVGFHGLEPAAGNDLAAVKRQFGRDLVLLGNVDVRVLCEDNPTAVRAEVARCIDQGAPGGGYMLATCNSIFAGMHPAAVRELFRAEADLA